MPIKEDQIMRPISPYAVSKSFQDLVSQVYQKAYGLKNNNNKNVFLY